MACRRWASWLALPQPDALTAAEGCLALADELDAGIHEHFDHPVPGALVSTTPRSMLFSVFNAMPACVATLLYSTR
jgi:hypothetical protein